MNEKKNTKQVFEQIAKEFGELVGLNLKEVRYITQNDKWWLSQQLDTLTGDHTTLVLIDSGDDWGNAIMLRHLIDIAIAGKRKRIVEIKEDYKKNLKTSELVNAKIEKLVKFLSSKKDTADCPDKIQESIEDIKELSQFYKDTTEGDLDYMKRLCDEIEKLVELKKTQHITYDDDDNHPEDGTDGVVA